MPSKSFSALSKRLVSLSPMMPTTAAGVTSFSQADQDRIAAFAILVCAACEYYVETRCLEVVQKSLTYLGTKEKLGRVGRHLLAFRYVSKANFEKHNETIVDSVFSISVHKADIKGNKADLQKKLGDRVQWYNDDIIYNNHGVRLNNLYNIMTPIGFKLSEVDPNLASNLGALSGMRGDAAHKSVVSASNWLHPTALVNLVGSLTKQLEVLDKQLTEFARR